MTSHNLLIERDAGVALFAINRPKVVETPPPAAAACLRP